MQTHDCIIPTRAFRPKVGLDDGACPWFAEQRMREAHQLLVSGSACDCEAYARAGVPPSIRTQVGQL